MQPAVRERTTANYCNLGATLNEPCRAVVEATVTWRAHREYSTIMIAFGGANGAATQGAAYLDQRASKPPKNTKMFDFAACRSFKSASAAPAPADSRFCKSNSMPPNSAIDTKASLKMTTFRAFWK